MDQERYIKEKKEERLKEIQERLNLTDEQIKNVNYRLLQEYEVPDWVKITKEKEKGVFSWNDGTKFEGKWYEGKKSGNGKLFYNNNSRYEGDFKNDHFDGKGVFFYKGYYFTWS